MGNTNLKASDLNPDNFQAVSKANFVYHFCIGKGGFGKVWRVERKKAKKYFAMKEMSKARIITKRSVKSVINERQILAQLKNPFIVNMYYAFQDRENLYLVMDYLSGGDLRYHICRHRRFSEEITRFFVACLVSGLEYFHEKNIIHRDIKPENLVVETDGYVRITDFGIARVWREENAQDTSGTPGYMAPEVMCRQNHTTSVDFFAVGVMAYECMFGRRPYIGKSRKEIRDHILSKQIQIKRNDIPRGWSIEAADFVNKMIQRKPQNRLGANGAEEVKQHPWLRDFPWDDLANKRLKAPFIPPQEDNFDQKNINEEWRDLEDEAFKANFISLRRNSTQELFQGYYYDHEVASFTEREVVQRSGLNDVIMQTIHQLEQKSQMQEPLKMATSSSSATISGIYSTSQLHKGHPQQESNGQLHHQSSIQSNSVMRDSILIQQQSVGSAQGGAGGAGGSAAHPPSSSTAILQQRSSHNVSSQSHHHHELQSSSNRRHYNHQHHQQQVAAMQQQHHHQQQLQHLPPQHLISSSNFSAQSASGGAGPGSASGGVNHAHGNASSSQALTSLQQQQQQTATSMYQGHMLVQQLPSKQQNNYVNEHPMNSGYNVQKQATSTTQRPMSNTAASTLNAGVITSQNSHSNSYSQSNSNKVSIKHSRHGSAKAASTMNHSSHQVNGGGSSLQLQQHLMQQTSQIPGGHHIKHNSASLAHYQANTLSQSHLHQTQVQMPQVSSSVINSAHKRNIHQLTQPTNFKQNHPNSNSLHSNSHGPASHYQNGSQTIMVQSSHHVGAGPGTLSMSHNYNNGLGLSVKQNQLRHSQHFQQQMLQSQQMPVSSSPGIMHIQGGQRHSAANQGQKNSQSIHSNGGSIKISPQQVAVAQNQGVQNNNPHMKPYVVHQKFAKSECPTPKSHEMEHRINSQQQKFFSRKSSGVAQAQVQNIQMTGLHQPSGSAHHVQAQMHLNQPIQNANISHFSRQVVQSQGHSRRQSGRSNDFNGTGSIQHVSNKVKGLVADPTVYDQRNGYSNRQKMIGSTYHASSLSFNKSGSKNSKQTIHSTYNGHHPSGTASGLHSHNSSIHSSHMKTRSPGNSQLSTMQVNANVQGGVIVQNPPQVLIANGVTAAAASGQGHPNGGNAPPNNLQMHHFHPSGTLHQKNSMSLGQYETTKIRRNNLVGPGTEKRKRTTKFK